MISIIIPVYNKESTLSECLESIQNNEYSDKEIIAIDDKSNDGSLDILKQYSKNGVIIIELDNHHGIAYAFNAGLKKASGDIVVRTDADTVVPKDWLGTLIKYFDDPEVVAVGGSYRCLNSASIIAYTSSTIDFVFSQVLKRKFLLTSLRGANRAIRRRALEDMKDLEGDFADSEDIRVFSYLETKGKIVYDPSITVETFYPDTLASLWIRHYKWGYAVGRQREYLKDPKSFLRPCFIGLFYTALLSAAGAYSSFILSLYAIFFILIMLSALKITKRPVIICMMPFIFLFQNTAYCAGMFKGLTGFLFSNKK